MDRIPREYLTGPVPSLDQGRSERSIDHAGLIRFSKEDFALRASAVLEYWIAHPTRAEQEATPFAARCAPSISVTQYLKRVVQYSRASIDALQTALCYLAVLTGHDGRSEGDIVLSNLNVHRLVISSIAVAAKVTDSVFYTGNFYAKVGGIKPEELHSLEVELKFRLQFRLFPSTFARRTLATSIKYGSRVLAFWFCRCWPQPVTKPLDALKPTLDNHFPDTKLIDTLLAGLGPLFESGVRVLTWIRPQMIEILLRNFDVMQSLTFENSPCDFPTEYVGLLPFPLPRESHEFFTGRFDDLTPVFKEAFVSYFRKYSELTHFLREAAEHVLVVAQASIYGTGITSLTPSETPNFFLDNPHAPLLLIQFSGCEPEELPTRIVDPDVVVTPLYVLQLSSSAAHMEQ